MCDIDLKDLHRDLSDVDWRTIEALRNVDFKLVAFNAVLLAVFDQHAPLTPMRVKHNPASCLATEIKDKMAKRNTNHDNLKLSKIMCPCIITAIRYVCRDTKRR